MDHSSNLKEFAGPRFASRVSQWGDWHWRICFVRGEYNVTMLYLRVDVVNTSRILELIQISLFRLFARARTLSDSRTVKPSVKIR
jgi:hypothetical protein